MEKVEYLVEFNENNVPMIVEITPGTYNPYWHKNERTLLVDIRVSKMEKDLDQMLRSKIALNKLRIFKALISRVK